MQKWQPCTFLSSMWDLLLLCPFIQIGSPWINPLVWTSQLCSPGPISMARLAVPHPHPTLREGFWPTGFILIHYVLPILSVFQLERSSILKLIYLKMHVLFDLLWKIHTFTHTHTHWMQNALWFLMHLVKSNKMEVWSSKKSGKASTKSQNAELVMISICKKKSPAKSDIWRVRKEQTNGWLVKFIFNNSFRNE